MTVRILAVCAGNTCRSPTAEAAIRQAAEVAGVDVKVDSAGTGAWSVGSPPHPQAIAAGDRAGLTITGRARRIIRADFGRFDVIVVMDRANLRDVVDLAPDLADRAKVRLFRTFDPATEAEEIPDPYGGPDEGYETMIEQVTSAAAGLIEPRRGRVEAPCPEPGDRRAADAHDPSAGRARILLAGVPGATHRCCSPIDTEASTPSWWTEWTTTRRRSWSPRAEPAACGVTRCGMHRGCCA